MKSMTNAEKRRRAMELEIWKTLYQIVELWAKGAGKKSKRRKR